MCFTTACIKGGGIAKREERGQEPVHIYHKSGVIFSWILQKYYMKVR